MPTTKNTNVDEALGEVSSIEKAKRKPDETEN
jgi:hypothetical protein